MFYYTVAVVRGSLLVGLLLAVVAFVVDPTSHHNACFTNARPPSHYWQVLLQLAFSFRNSLLFVFVLDFFVFNHLLFCRFSFILVFIILLF